MKAMGDLNHNYETPSSIYLPIVPDNSDIVLNMVHQPTSNMSLGSASYEVH